MFDSRLPNSNYSAAPVGNMPYCVDHLYSMRTSAQGSSVIAQDAVGGIRLFDVRMSAGAYASIRDHSPSKRVLPRRFWVDPYERVILTPYETVERSPSPSPGPSTAGVEVWKLRGDFSLVKTISSGGELQGIEPMTQSDTTLPPSPLTGRVDASHAPYITLGTNDSCSDWSGGMGHGGDPDNAWEDWRRLAGLWRHPVLGIQLFRAVIA